MIINNNEINIIHLDANINHTNEIINLISNEFGTESITQVENSLNYWDKCFIATQNGEILGFSMLVIYDFIPELRHLYPWVANVYTKEQFRQQGIATMCLKAVIEEATNLNFKHLYLWAEKPKESLIQIYQHKGFNEIKTHNKIYYNDKEIIIMQYTLVHTTTT